MGHRTIYPRVFGVTKWKREGTEPVFGPPAFQLCTVEPRPVIYSLILIYLPPFSGFWYLHLYDDESPNHIKISLHCPFKRRGILY